ncbi:MAG TPA: hypothetical protein VFX38_03475 [Gammaproteobacteria bacterium]|nr:hypothetical protein [Gammaproteobacteria bacterium]
MSPASPHRFTRAEWLEAFTGDPDVFFFRLDASSRKALLVRLDAERIREAAFLDERALKGDEDGVWLPLDALLETPASERAPQGIILHCGHCGSTLISRLLGELPATRVLREPLVLQDLAAEFRLAGSAYARLRPEELRRTLVLAGNSFAKASTSATHVIVKHTSFTANLGVSLLESGLTPAVLLLWIPLEEYLATMLRDPGLRQGLRQAASQWLHDLVRELGAGAPRLAELADGEVAALNWTAAQLAFARVAERSEARLLAWPFGDFLAHSETRLRQLARHFALDADEAEIRKALASPWLRRYAKDPRYPFDAGIRARELDAARTRFAAEIDKGCGFARGLWDRLRLEHAPGEKP